MKSMKLKRLFAALLVGSMVFSLAACGEQGAQKEETSEEQEASEDAFLAGLHVVCYNREN